MRLGIVAGAAKRKREQKRQRLGATHHYQHVRKNPLYLPHASITLLGTRCQVWR
jgi:hypothetical protein